MPSPNHTNNEIIGILSTYEMVVSEV